VLFGAQPSTGQTAVHPALSARSRFALYFTPAPGSPLAELGRRWLGRDIDTGASGPRYEVAGLDADAALKITASPRRYGFHATLKAPFRLAAGHDLDDLRAAVAAFAAAHAPVDVGPLSVAQLAGFIALVPHRQPPALTEFAAACVADLDRFRAPMPEDERRRRAQHLSAAQARHLDRWGYPFVFEEFRFHMTLTDRVPDPLAATLVPALADLAAPALRDALTIDAVSLIAEAAPPGPFVVLDRYALTGRDKTGP
jgi:putative phosphonate metabolism protein